MEKGIQRVAIKMMLAFLVIFGTQRIFINLQFNTTAHEFWNGGNFLFGNSSPTEWGVRVGVFLFLFTFMCCVFGAIIISDRHSNSFKNVMGLSIVIPFIAIFPTIMVLLTNPSSCYCPLTVFYDNKIEFSIILIISSVMGGFIGYLISNKTQSLQDEKNNIENSDDTKEKNA